MGSIQERMAAAARKEIDGNLEAAKQRLLEYDRVHRPGALAAAHQFEAQFISDLDRKSRALGTFLRNLSPGWLNSFDPCFRILFRTHFAVAIYGSAEVFISSVRHKGWPLALAAVREAEKNRWPQPDIPPILSDTETTTPSQRRAGAAFTPSDLRVQDLVIRLAELGLPAPEGLDDSIPSPSESTYADWTRRYAASLGQRTKRLFKQDEDWNTAEDMRGRVLRTWLPLALWRFSSSESMERMNQVRERKARDTEASFNESVRTLGLACSRWK